MSAVLFRIPLARWVRRTIEKMNAAGKSPLELAGLEDLPTLAEVLTQLVSARGQTEPEAVQDAETLAQLESLFYSEPTRVAA